MAREDAFLAALAGTAQHAVEAGELTLRAADGRVLTLLRATVPADAGAAR